MMSENESKTGSPYWDAILNEALAGESELEPKQKTKARSKARYALGDKFAGIYFTRREAECMALLLNGKRNIDIAEELVLSTRTTEYYFGKMKEKLGISTKFDLIEKVMQSDFPQFKEDIIKELVN